MTNCVAFLPLLLVRGKTGEFIYSLPVVVAASLVSSRIVSMTFMPLLGYYVLRGQKGTRAAGGASGWSAVLARCYRGFAGWCLGHKAITLTRLRAGPLRRRGPAAAVGHGLLSQGPARRVQRQRLPGRRLADPPDAAKRRSRSFARSKPWRATRSAPTRRSSARADRGSGSRSCPSSGPTTTPRSWCTRSIRARRRRWSPG